ncbi:pre-mRNA-splicing factor CWC25 homolog [Prorops nasuta]|uniref:pre-mRNA-splicing factor CWC25 homolog n=1 Tax=Prorops nasuta TaxID=863751 RepID=UPI0034CE7085
MGGGDLNLKKSWHPSTMKNMEKVWKAEQESNQEKKRIAELEREIQMEKDRENITKYAMEQGVIDKKDDKKLDWMYKGPNQLINREEYLLGRPIDKSFEQLAKQEKEKDFEIQRVQKNHVEYECIPPSLRFFSGNEQVDLQRKLQEDPLFAIKKKEKDTRNQLFKNPVKLHQLKELLEQQKRKSKKNKKKKAKKHDDEKELDELLTAKYKKLQDKIKRQDILKSVKMHKHKKKSRKLSSSYDSESSENSDDGTSEKDRVKNIKKFENKQKRLRRASTYESSDEDIEMKVDIKTQSKSEKEKCLGTSYASKKKETHNSKHYRNRSKSPKKEESSSHCYNTEKVLLQKKDYSTSRKYRDYSEEKETIKSYGLVKADGTKISLKKSPIHKTYIKKEEKKKEQPWKPKPRQRLTEEEKETRRQEMMANASWRDKERERNIKRYRDEDKRENENSKSFNKDFLRQQLAAATNTSTVASRIRSNINNIQRSGRAMDTNFARR